MRRPLLMLSAVRPACTHALRRLCTGGVRAPAVSVSTAWLADRLNEPHNGLTVVEAAYGQRAQHGAKHRRIPSALYAGIDDFVDPYSVYKNMLPDAPGFRTFVQETLGLPSDTRSRHVVVYDRAADAPSFLPATRLWFTLRYFGYDNVSVLDGGLRAWTERRLPTETWADRDCTVPIGTYEPYVARGGTVMPYHEIVHNIDHPRFQLVDVRPADLHTGLATAPGAARRGHPVGSMSMPATSLLDADGTLLSCGNGDLQMAVEGHGVELDRPVVCMCHTGVFAAAAAYALTLLRCEQRSGRPVAIYDGSWFEFSRRAASRHIEVTQTSRRHSADT